MLALGGFLVGLTILALGVLIPLFRDPDGPSWTKRLLINELVTVALVATLALGLGYVGAGIITAVEQGLDLVDVGLLLAVAAGTVVLWPLLKVRARLRAIEAGSGAAGPRLVTSGPGGPAPVQPVPTGPHRPQRRAA